MTGAHYKQLSPFELKYAITELLQKINSVNDIQGCLAEFDMLEAQENKTLLSKILFKELASSSKEKIPLICFLLEHFIPKEELINKLWTTLKNQNLQTEVKITILNLLRDLDSDWSYETCEEYLANDAKSLLDENTKHLLNTAVINPEVQIDFLDFMATIRTNDKITLIKSLDEDFSSDAMANILIPVFMSSPNSPEGREALKILGETKSQLALHALEEMKHFTDGELQQAIKKSLSTLKISGIRTDNTKAFYKGILSNSEPYKFYVTYPDGHGDIAMIFTRLTQEDRIRFVSIVTNTLSGIKDCFGFYEISKFEYSKILERFLRDEKTVEVTPEAFRTILYNSELTTLKNQKNEPIFPYEYVCWRNLLIDIDFEEKPITQILNENLNATEDKNILAKLNEMKISSHWFLDANYSKDFIDVLKSLNDSENLEQLISDHVLKVFDDTEQQDWTLKLLIAAFLKFSKGKKEEANIIYGLANSKENKYIMFQEILKRSIYEYLMIVKYDKNIDTYNLTHEKINDKIKYIEEKWVNNV